MSGYPLLDEIRAQVGDEMENLVGGLLHLGGFEAVRFTSPVSRRPDGGVDLRASFTMPLRGKVRFLIAVTGSQLSAKRLADFRGRCRQDEEALAFAHAISPRVREQAPNGGFGVVIHPFDVEQIAREIERLKATVPQLLAAGRQLRARQHG